MDLKKDIRDKVLATLPHKPGVRGELERMSLSSLLIVFNNWRRRIPYPKRYYVFRSEAFNVNSLRAVHSAALRNIELDLINGRPVWPYLSRRITKYGYVANSTSASKDKDHLLNDWGIHHLHLGVSRASDGFVERSPDLLFAVFWRENAYFVDLGGHSDFANPELARTIIREWPESSIFQELVGIIPPRDPEYQPTDEHRHNLRQAGVAATLECDGHVYVSGRGSVSTAGTTTEDCWKADMLLSAVERFQREYALNPRFLELMRECFDITLPAQPNFEFVFLDGDGGVREKQTGEIVRIDGEGFGYRMASR